MHGTWQTTGGGGGGGLLGRVAAAALAVALALYALAQVIADLIILASIGGVTVVTVTGYLAWRGSRPVPLAPVRDTRMSRLVFPGHRAVQDTGAVHGPAVIADPPGRVPELTPAPQVHLHLDASAIAALLADRNQHRGQLAAAWFTRGAPPPVAPGPEARRSRSRIIRIVTIRK